MTSVGQRRQTGFHFIAINDAMPLGGTGACLKGIDDEALHKINSVGRIKRLPHRPEFGEMPAIDARHRVINDVPRLSRLSTSRCVNIGACGQNQRGNMLRVGGSDLNRNGGAGMVADDGRAPNAECDKELVCGQFSIDALPSGSGSEFAVSDRVHGNGAVMPTKKRKHVAKLVPG
jgi:hypothetical protein